MMPAPNMVIQAKPKERSGIMTVNAQVHIPATKSDNLQATQNASLYDTDEGSYSMPFLDAQEKWVAEHGYGVRIPSQSFFPPPTIQTYRFGRAGIPSLGNVGMSSNIDSKLRGPNMHLINQGIHYYQDNSNNDYVALLAPHIPTVALWKAGREVANLLANE